MRKSKIHTKHTIEEKNQIVLLYLDKHMGVMSIVRKYGIGSKSDLYKWINQYREYGTCIDNRGKATKLEAPNKGRPRKYNENLEDLTKEQLIERLNLYKDIKKSLVYLNKEQRNKNTK